MEASFHPTSWKEAVGVNLPVEKDDLEHDYEWLDVIDEDDCYMALDVSDSKSNKSLEFGSGGYTGSLSAWHELLQLTCPDLDCGVVFVRGDFPDNADSILARAQRRNQKGTFGLGLHVSDDKDYVLEMTPAQGYVNLRYPITKLHLVRQSELFGSETFASYTSCSFVKDGTVYQIARILPSHLASSTSSSVRSRPPRGDWKPMTITVDLGGVIRFGCACSSAHRNGIDGRALGPIVPLFHDHYRTVQDTYVLGCESAVHRKRLEMRLWINQQPEPLKLHPCKSARLDHACGQARDHQPIPGDSESYPHEVWRMHFRKDLDFREDKPTVLVATFNLVDSNTLLDKTKRKVIHYADVLEYLGVADDSTRATYRLWTNTLNGLSGKVEEWEIKAIGRAVESTYGIASVPLAVPTEVGGTPRNLGVALIKNIVASPIVDLESTLWQARMLVKAANLLGSQPLAELLPANTYDFKRNTYQDMQNAHRAAIVDRIRGVCLWLLRFSDRIVEKGGFRKLRDPDVGILVSDVLPAPAERPKCQPRLLPVLQNNIKSGDDDERDDDRPGHGSLRSTRLRAQRFYLAITLWYVVNQLPEVFLPENDIKAQEIHDCLWEHIQVLCSMRNEDNRAHAIASEDSHGCFARWYHSFSVHQLCVFLQRRNPNRFEDTKAQTDPIMRKAFYWQGKAEKSLRLYRQGRLREFNMGHEAANLAMLGPELGIIGHLPILRARSCLEVVRNLVDARQPTKRLNAGRAVVIRWDPKNKTRSAKPRPAPWELSCLAQHLPISLGALSVQGKRRGDCLELCNKFLLADSTYSSSWDTSKTTTTGQWWDFITSSIICAEFLDNAVADSAADAEPETPDTSQTTATDDGNNHDQRLARLEATVMQMHQLILQNVVDRRYTKKSEATSGNKFDWLSFRPKPLFHADTTVQSLEDTPDFYHLKQTKNLKLQANIAKYLEDNAMPPNEWSLETIKDAIHASKLHHLSCFDFALMVDRNDLPEISKPFVRGRANSDFWEKWTSEKQPERSAQLLKLLRGNSALMDLYLIGKAVEYPGFPSWPQDAQNLLQNEDLKTELLDAYQDSLFMALNDSLADQGTKYRILFAKRLSPATLQAMIFMWHPDAIDTYDAHLGELSQFNDDVNQSITGGEDTWITSITISHFRLHDRTESMILRAENEVDDAERKVRKDKLEADEALRKRTKKTKSPTGLMSLTSLYRRLTSKRPTRNETATTETVELDAELASLSEMTLSPNHATFEDPESKKQSAKGRVIKDDFPPQNVGEERRGKIHDLRLSLAITGDNCGRNWTCSMVCELFSEEDAATYAQEVAETLQMFIHEQDTGRALVFMLLLGYMCEALNRECDIVMKELDLITGRNAEVLLEGLDWQKSEMALKQLKRMLWGLEALRVFRDKLEKAMEALDKARDVMILKVKKREAIQHKDMKRTVQRITNEFVKRSGHVRNTLRSMQQRIDEGNKLEQGMASVISVEQNENISMLTWLTIIYLAPAFIVGVFGMGHDIVPAEAGWMVFGWLLVVFITVTIASALSLQFIIEKLRAIGHWVGRIWNLHPRDWNGVVAAMRGAVAWLGGLFRGLGVHTGR